MTNIRTSPDYLMLAGSLIISGSLVGFPLSYKRTLHQPLMMLDYADRCPDSLLVSTPVGGLKPGSTLTLPRELNTKQGSKQGKLDNQLVPEYYADRHFLDVFYFVAMICLAYDQMAVRELIRGRQIKHAAEKHSQRS